MTATEGTRGVRFEWVSGKDISHSNLEKCSALFSNHYGTYGESHTAWAGKPISLSPERLQELLLPPGAGAALAWHRDELVAHAFAIRGGLVPEKTITWVTQLVVHTDFRHSNVAKRLLSSVWGFSDHQTW